MTLPFKNGRGTMKINGVTIQMLPAASGDCIYLEFPDSDFRMLIDGGYAKTYQKYLKKFLLKLAAEGKRLNLIVVTHIDDDHISGIRALLKENGDSRNPKIIEIDEIWFNSLNQCITSRNAEQGMSFAVKIILKSISDTVYKKTVPVDVVFTTSTYNKIYNLPMSSGDWFDSSEINKTLCMVVNKAAQNYFDTSYAVGNVESSLSLTPFNVVGTVNDGTDIPTVYLDAHSIELLVPNMWKVKNATVHWHSEAGITMRQMYSSLHDILEDTIGGNLDIIGKSDIGDTYNSVLSVLQLGLLVTSFLLLFVSVLGQINIGLSSLEQRTHELLIRRAIGASRANIVTLVLGAQLTISVFVCIVSILISFFLVQGMGLFLPVDSPVAALEYPILSAVVAVITSVVVALLGGLLPALKAAKLEPALALR